VNDLQPLLEETTGNARLRALLEAGRADTPPGEFQGRLMLGLGLGAAAIGGVSSAAAASVGKSALSPAAAAGQLAPSVASLVAKWVVVGVCSGGLLAGGAQLLAPRGVPPEPSVGGVASVGTATRTGVSLPAPASALANEQVDPLPALEPTSKAARAALSAAPAASERVVSEVQLIDAARQALSEGRLRQALSQLDTYDRSVKSGVLLREARVLRIEALHRAGETGRAHSLARQYLLEFPQDAHAPRLRSLTFPTEAP
jgi:hypothetical protein